MKTTSIILLASAALTGIALIIWKQIASRQPIPSQLGDEPRSRHRTPVFSKMKQHVQENI